jgi:hypothetical protein
LPELPARDGQRDRRLCRFPAGGSGFEGEPPARFASSPDVIRQFCGVCGTPLSFKSPRWPGEIHLLVGSADHFQGLQPTGHAFCEYRVPWFEVADELPRHRSSPSQSGT